MRGWNAVLDPRECANSVMRKHPGPSATARPTQTSRLLTSGETGGGEEDSGGVHDGFGLGCSRSRESREESVSGEKNERSFVVVIISSFSSRQMRRTRAEPAVSRTRVSLRPSPAS